MRTARKGDDNSAAVRISIAVDTSRWSERPESFSSDCEMVVRFSPDRSRDLVEAGRIAKESARWFGAMVGGRFAYLLRGLIADEVCRSIEVMKAARESFYDAVDEFITQDEMEAQGTQAEIDRHQDDESDA